MEQIRSWEAVSRSSGHDIHRLYEILVFITVQIEPYSEQVECTLHWHLV
jgi:hypothetical protein